MLNGAGRSRRKTPLQSNLTLPKVPYALCIKTPQRRYARYPDGTPVLDDNWLPVKAARETDWGLAALLLAWARIYKLLWDNDIKLMFRCYARDKGWVPRSKNSYREWEANCFRKRKRFYKRVKGMGRWHLHATMLFVRELTRQEIDLLISKIQKILGTKNYYNVYFEPAWSVARHNRYILKNIKETVLPSGVKHLRLIGKARSIENFEELSLPQKSLQTGSEQGFISNDPDNLFIANTRINKIYEEVKGLLTLIPYLSDKLPHSPPFLVLSP